MDEGSAPTRSLDLGDLRAAAVLGRGAKGIVFLVHDRKSTSDDRRYFALKAISRSNLASKKESDGYRRVWFEREVLSCIRFPLLPTLHGLVSTDEIVGFAIDRCSGGDLNGLRKRQTEKMFSDDIIRFYAAELVLALEHLHGLGIVYRDLKPENVLIQDSGHLMLVDFDLSTKLSPKPAPAQTCDDRLPDVSGRRGTPGRLRSWFSCNSGSAPQSMDSEIKVPSSGSTSTSSSISSTSSTGTKSNSFVGTEEYVAPEIIEGTGHDFAVDWWSLGVVLYEMLYGRTPFQGQNRKETFYRILTKSPDLVGETTPLRDLIGKLLEKDPSKRIAIQGIKQHEFFHGVDWEAVIGISRPPFIPAVDSDVEGGCEEEPIDVEKFVREVFDSSASGACDDVANEKETVVDTGKSSKEGNTAATCGGTGSENKGNWVDGLGNPSPTSDFLVF